MDDSQFEDHLDRYGADLSGWPDALRQRASALMTTSAGARAAFRSMAEVEAVVRGSGEPGSFESGSFGADAIAARAMQHRQIRPVPVAARRAGWAAAAAAALILGMFVGDLGPQREDGPDPVVAAALDTMGTIDAD